MFDEDLVMLISFDISIFQIKSIHIHIENKILKTILTTSYSHVLILTNITKNKIAISLKNLPKDTYLIDFHLNNKSTRLEVQIE